MDFMVMDDEPTRSPAESSAAEYSPFFGPEPVAAQLVLNNQLHVRITAVTCFTSFHIFAFVRGQAMYRVKKN